MKKTVYIMLAVAVLGMTGCKSSRQAVKPKSPIPTYDMPCAEMVSGEGMLRAWAMGRSDNEATARKKAQANASAELAAMLKKTVESTTEDYTAALTDGLDAASKSFFSEKVKITVNKSLSGAVIVCDEWNKDVQTGMYTNYIVMELSGEELLSNLYKEVGNDVASQVDKALLRRLFLQHINAAK